MKPASTAAVMGTTYALSVNNTQTSTTVLEGNVGGALSAYKKTPEGKVVVGSMTDAFNNLVRATKNYQAQEATGPHGMGTGGKLKVN